MHWQRLYVFSVYQIFLLFTGLSNCTASADDSVHPEPIFCVCMLQKSSTKTALDTYLEKVTTAIQNAIDRALPHTCSSIHTREGWTEECKAVLTKTKRLKREYSMCHTVNPEKRTEKKETIRQE